MQKKLGTGSFNLLCGALQMAPNKSFHKVLEIVYKAMAAYKQGTSATAGPARPSTSASAAAHSSKQV